MPMRAQPYKIELLKSGLMALCGLLLALQEVLLLAFIKSLQGWTEHRSSERSA